MSLLPALCNVCKHMILIDRYTGNKFDAQDIGHRHKAEPPKQQFNPGALSNDQVVAMAQKKNSGYCDTCQRAFRTFHDAWVHGRENSGHAVRSIENKKV